MPEQARPLWRELWLTGAWRLFPLLAIYMSGLTLLVPHIPGITLDYFAARRAGHDLHCDALPREEAQPDAAACRDAHADVVLWSSWTSFFSNSLVSIVLTPLLGHWSDLHGRKPFFLVAQACACIPLAIVLLHLTCGTPLLWYYVVQVFVSSLSSVTPSLAFIADLLSPAHRAATFGLILAIFSVAIFVGPAAGATMAPLTATLGALGTVAVCAVYTLLLLPESLSGEAKTTARLRHAQARHQHQDGGGEGGVVATSTLRAARILLRSPLFKRLTLCMMLTGVVSEGLQDLLVQYLKLKIGFGVADVSHLFMILGATGLLVQTLALPALLGWLGEQRVLVLALAASAAQELLLAAAGSKAVALGAIALGSLSMMSFPTISSIKSNNAQEHEQGAVQGALYGARALASGTGPLLFALLFSAFTKTDSPLPYFPGAPFVFGFVLMLLAMGVAATIPSDAGGSGGSVERAGSGCGGSSSGGGDADTDGLLVKASVASGAGRPVPGEARPLAVDGEVAGPGDARPWPSSGASVRDLEGGRDVRGKRDQTSGEGGRLLS